MHECRNALIHANGNLELEGKFLHDQLKIEYESLLNKSNNIITDKTWRPYMLCEKQ